MLITQGNLKAGILKGEVAIVTGSGRGIGYEAARALIWLGANVIIAEIDDKTGQTAQENLEKEFGKEKALFIKTDIGNEKDVEKLAKEATKKWGKIDIVLNNATVFPMGAVKDSKAEQWDFSYRVNLRGPVLLAETFLPDMMKRKHGAFTCVSSSGAAPYMGAYEVFKTAQGELARTIAAELENTGVYAFTIGPGIVKTPGFIEGGGQVAKYMGITLEQLLELNKRVEITPEAAGVGFAAAIANAKKYHGQEISSIQALHDIGIDLGEEPETKPSAKKAETKQAMALYQPVLKTYEEQLEGWKSRNIFQRQWVMRDFKNTTGMSVEEMLTNLHTLGDNLHTGAPIDRFVGVLKKLEAYYEHQLELLKGFEKVQAKRQEGINAIALWTGEVKALIEALGG